MHELGEPTITSQAHGEGTGPGATPAAIEAWDVRKRFGRGEALRGVDLRVSSGRTLAIVGPNGAGKSTLLRVLATLARPSSGVVLLGGVPVADDLVAARRRLGVVFESTFLYDELTGAENLAYYARLYGLRDGRARATMLAGLVGLESRLHDRVGVYSRGMAQRLSLARALLHRPDALLLDEPDAGLDPAATVELPRLLRGDSVPERAIVLTTHDLDLALTLADDVAILVGGRFVFAAPTATLTLVALRQAYHEATDSLGSAPPTPLL